MNNEIYLKALRVVKEREAEQFCIHAMICPECGGELVAPIKGGRYFTFFLVNCPTCNKDFKADYLPKPVFNP